MFDYEKLIYDTILEHNQVWVKKATGLGVTEFLLRLMCYIALSAEGSSKFNIDINTDAIFTIVTGPRIDLAIDLIARLRNLFENVGVTFQDKNTVVHLGHVKIEAFPSHHLDSMRGLPNVKFILLDEADFFPPNEQQNARAVSERYLAKSGARIIMVSTPNNPEGLFHSIEQERDCLYKRLQLDYSYGLGSIYTAEEINLAKQSPSFEREYNLKYAGLIGNTFHITDIERALERGKTIDTSVVNPHTPKSMGIDVAYGSSSAFSIVITEYRDGQIVVLYVGEWLNAGFDQMLNKTISLVQRFGVRRSLGGQIFVDGSAPEMVSAIKHQLGERPDYLQEAEYYRKYSKDYQYERDWSCVPVNFNQRNKDLLLHLKRIVEDNGGILSIPPVPNHEKLVTALRTAISNDGKLDKQQTSHDDVLDAMRLAADFYHG